MLPTTLYAKNPDTGEYVELTQFYDQNRSPVVFDEIAPVMYDAILSSEDKNFYKHGGIDLVGTVSAVYDNVRGHDTRGGSSISQQYVKNILVQRCEANATAVTEEKDGQTVVVMTRTRSSRTATPRRRRPRARRACSASSRRCATRSPSSRSTRRTRSCSATSTSRASAAPTYGVDAAARYYFDVAAKDLSVGQAAALAGMVQNPNAYRIDKKDGSTTEFERRAGQQRGRRLQAHEGSSDLRARPSARRRQDHPGAARHRRGRADHTRHHAAQDRLCVGALGGRTSASTSRTSSRPTPPSARRTRTAIKALQRGGLKIYTTLDYRLQNAAQDIMSQTAPGRDRRHELRRLRGERRGRDRPRALDGAEHAVQRGQGHDRRRSVVQDASSTRPTRSTAARSASRPARRSSSSPSSTGSRRATPSRRCSTATPA